MTPPRKSYTMKSIIESSFEFPQSVYEDLDTPRPDRNQFGVTVKPIPRPRSKLKSKDECTPTNTTDGSADPANNTTTSPDSHFYEYPEDYVRPKPVRPPPKPPVSTRLNTSKPTVGVNGGNENTDTERSVKPLAVRKQCPPPPPLRPRGPPPPPKYFDRLSLTMRPTSEVYTDETSSDEVVSLCGSHRPAVADFAGRPAVGPRPRSSSLSRSAATRPPLPSTPPPSGRQTESVYTEIEYHTYLEILPEDDEDMTRGGSRLSSGQHHPSGSHQQPTPHNEGISGMLRWLKRVSKSDSLAPSLCGLSIEDEIRSFNQRAVDLRKALRLYNLLMMKRNERLRVLIAEFSSISHTLDKIQKKSKTMGIAGGTTGAVGGVTAVLGMALAPVTMGISLVATAVGAGMVASAGGMGAHTAQQAKKKIVNRTAVEKLVDEYKTNVADLEHCLDFILCAMSELRRHDIPRLRMAGAQTDALKMAHLSQCVVGNYMNSNRKGYVPHPGRMPSEGLLQAFAKEVDQYFTEKDGQKLKKSNKTRFSGRVRLLAENLQDELDHLNHMWEMFS